MNIGPIVISFGGFAALALLPGCGSAQLPSEQHFATTPARLAHHQTFRFTGAQQSFTVPAGVTSVKVVALGAAGEMPSNGASSGDGGRVSAVVPVQSLEVLYVYVGGTGSYGRRGKGGFNGGAKGGALGLGGGGASDVRQGGNELADRIVVAGGGGGGSFKALGGAGGGNTGGSGGSVSGNGGGGGGGTQTTGGKGGAPGKMFTKSWRGHRGKNGTLGNGGNHYTFFGIGGGGGGGGYYGGGGGGGGAAYYGYGGGGGGGSSYIEPNAQRGRMWRGWKSATGNGLVVLSWQ